MRSGCTEEFFSEKAFLKVSQNSQRNICARSLCNTGKGLQAIRLAALLKRDPSTGVSEPAVRRCCTK